MKQRIRFADLALLCRLDYDSPLYVSDGEETMSARRLIAHGLAEADPTADRRVRVTAFGDDVARALRRRPR